MYKDVNFDGGEFPDNTVVPPTMQFCHVEQQEYSTAFKKPQTDSLGVLRTGLVISLCYMKQEFVAISDMCTKKRFLLVETWYSFNKIRVFKRSPKQAKL